LTGILTKTPLMLFVKTKYPLATSVRCSIHLQWIR